MTANATPTPDRRALLQQALAAVEDMQARLDRAERARTEPIAIVGIGCRFPGGANDPEAYWRLLCDGVDAIRRVPGDRFDAAGGDAEHWYGGFIDQIDQFDPGFFGIAPREAQTMDPQQRLVLEVAWEALENAALAPDRLKGSATGVFIGITTNDYAHMALRGQPDRLDVYTATGGALNVAAGRLAYTLGLHGPALAVDSACSSSLVAVHLAIQSLRNGESDQALAGGVNALLSPEAFVCFDKWGMMAPDGRCKTFDTRADGFVRGEGCGIVVLKRLSDAQANGDRILALIRGSAVNQDGASSGLTVPNGKAQATVVRSALANAGVLPAEVGYVEAHGTGTSLGDPIEVEALGNVLKDGRGPDQPLILGSVKTNLGHLESAAGIAGLIKTVLVLQHGQVPPHLHLEERSPRIPWPAFRVDIPRAVQAWRPNEQGRRIAGVSAFGFSGTNAHVVLEEAPPSPVTQVRPEPHASYLVPLAGHSESALRHATRQLAEHLNAQPVIALSDVAFTLGAGRVHANQQRLAIVATDTAGLKSSLNALANGLPGPQVQQGATAGARPRVAFIFPGQGAQRVGMGAELFDHEPVFRAVLERCDALLRAEMEIPLLAVLYPDRFPDPRVPSIEAANALLTHTAYTQPALFALGYALAEVWREWGVEPSVVLGHSVGELVAACVAGVFDLEAGVRLAAGRGRVLQALPSGGAMAAVRTGYARAARAIEGATGELSIAAINAPDQIVLAGVSQKLDDVLTELRAEDVPVTRLSVSHAFHSPLVDPALDELQDVAARVDARPARRARLIRGLDGQAWDHDQAPDAHYWRRHAREAVHFGAAITTARDLGCDAFIELGPAATLVAAARANLEPTVAASIAWLPSLRPGQSDRASLLHSLASLYVRGADVSWSAVAQSGQPIALPTTPFERTRYWLPAPSQDPRRTTLSAHRARDTHPLLGAPIDLALGPAVRVWQATISTLDVPFLADHRIQGTPVYPATAYLEMVLAAAHQVFGEGPLLINQVEYHAPIALGDGMLRRVQTVFEIADRGATFRISSRAESDAEWTLNATGAMQYDPALAAQPSRGAVLEDVRRRSTERLSGPDFYQQLAAHGNDWGPTFQGVQEVWRSDHEALSRVAIPSSLGEHLEQYRFHPAISDACGHVLAAIPAHEPSGRGTGGGFVGGSIGEVRHYRRPIGMSLWTYARLRPASADESNVIVGDVQVIDETGEVVSESLDVHLWYLDGDRPRTVRGVDRLLYTLEWEDVPRGGVTRPEVLPERRGEWLILADRAGVGTALAERLRAGGESAAIVQPTDGPSSITEIIGATTTRAIVSLRALDAAPGESNLLLDDAVQIVRSIVQASASHLPRLWLVTRGAQHAATTPTAPQQASLWGLGRTLALEHAELRPALVDLDPHADLQSVASSLAAELLSETGENQIALRGERRYVARLARLEAGTSTPGTDVEVRPDATYLITGGLGGLGLSLARWLAERGARNLALVSRGGRARCSDHQTRALAELESLGVRVSVIAADVADETQMRAALRQTVAEGLPAVRGLIHAAGVVEQLSLLDLAPGSIDAALRAKVYGSALLDRLMPDLDFFVLFSSASALLGPPRLAAYAAANSYMDALAHARRGTGQHALSINWGAWSEVGMAARFERGDVAAHAERGMGTLSTNEALAAFEHVLGLDTAQVAVLPVDWKRWQQLYPALVEVPLFTRFVERDSHAEGSVVANRGRAIHAARGGERAALVEEYLAAMAAHVLGFPAADLDRDQPLSSFGLDSLMAVELKNGIETELGVVVPMVSFLEGRTTVELGAQVVSLLEQAATEDIVAPDVDALSEAEVDRLLEQLLAGEAAS
jgi:acyl transferase domain-containing protein/acyl carrier protein